MIIIPELKLAYVWLEYIWYIRVADIGVILVGLVMWGTKPWDITSSKNSFFFYGCQNLVD